MSHQGKGTPTSAGRIVASVFSNYAGFIVRIATTLVTTPLFIEALGRGRYGSWVLLWSIASYLTILDLGLGIAIRKFVAQAIAVGDIRERNVKFNACLSVYLLLSVAVFVVGWPVLGFLGRTVSLDESVKPMIWNIGLFLTLDVAFAFPINAFQGLLTAYQRYELTNAIRVTIEVLRNVVLIIAARMGANLVGLAGLQLGSTCLMFLLMVLAARHVAGPLELKLFRLNVSTLRSILNYSGWVVIFLGAQQAINLSSSVIVGLYDTAMVVTEFYVAYRLVSFLVGIPSLMTSVLVPLSSERDALGDFSSLQRVFLVGSNAQALLLTPAVAGTILLGNDFFSIWLGSGFERSSFYLVLLVIPIVLTQGTACSIALGAGRQKYIAVVTLVSAVSTLFVALFAGRIWGVTGICAAYSLVGIVFNIIIYVFSCHLLNLGVSSSLYRIWCGPLVAVAAQYLLTALLIPLYSGTHGIGYLLLLTALSIAIYGAATGMLYLFFPANFMAFQKLLQVIRSRMALNPAIATSARRPNNDSP